MKHPTESKTWHDQWWAKYVLAEIPIIGGFFSKKSRKETLHDAGKCITTLVCSTATMIAVLPVKQEDDFLLASFKMLSSMAIGTTSGKILYNGMSNGTQLLYQYCNKSTEITTHMPLPTHEPNDIELRAAPSTNILL